MQEPKWRMAQSTKEVELEYKGEKFTVTVRPISWSKKNSVISECLSYSDKGEARFNIDRYNKECLCYAIVKAPWGETDNIFLTSVDDQLGAQLQKLVPSPFGGEAPQSFLPQESEKS